MRKHFGHCSRLLFILSNWTCQSTVKIVGKESERKKNDVERHMSEGLPCEISVHFFFFEFTYKTSIVYQIQI